MKKITLFTAGLVVSMFAWQLQADEAVAYVVVEGADIHTIAEGDDLYAIAERFGTTTDLLIEYNDLPSNEIEAESVLIIPD